MKEKYEEEGGACDRRGGDVGPGTGNIDFIRKEFNAQIHTVTVHILLQYRKWRSSTPYVRTF